VSVATTAGTVETIWILLALASGLFSVLRNAAMKQLGHALDEYIKVWGRFIFIVPFALLGCLLRPWPTMPTT
jgi:uncharacterized membrane protein YdcZ (DUF606 family)